MGTWRWGASGRNELGFGKTLAFELEENGECSLGDLLFK